MTTREEIVIGYQLIRQMNTSNRMLDGASLVLQGLDPRDETPLKFRPMGETGPLEIATITEIKKQATICGSVVTKCARKVDEFISRYPNKQAIDNGLVHFKTPKVALDTDREAVKTHNNNMLTAIGLVTTKEQLTVNGQLLALYKPQIDIDVGEELIPLDQQLINTYQDLLSTISLELRGLHEDSGVLTYTTVKQRKDMVKGRLITAERWYQKVAGMTEVVPMKQMFDYVIANLDGINTTAALEAMAAYLDSHVPQVPAVRRWWNF